MCAGPFVLPETQGNDRYWTMTRGRPQKPQDRRPKTDGRGRTPWSALCHPSSSLPRGWRLWVLRATCVFAAPIVFLLLLEGGLFLCGAGYPTSFFITSHQRGVLTRRSRRDKSANQQGAYAQRATTGGESQSEHHGEQRVAGHVRLDRYTRRFSRAGRTRTQTRSLEHDCRRSNRSQDG